jgi:hypothetical protein
MFVSCKKRPIFCCACSQSSFCGRFLDNSPIQALFWKICSAGYSISKPQKVKSRLHAVETAARCAVGSGVHGGPSWPPAAARGADGPVVRGGRSWRSGLRACTPDGHVGPRGETGAGPSRLRAGQLAPPYMMDRAGHLRLRAVQTVRWYVAGGAGAPGYAHVPPTATSGRAARPELAPRGCAQGRWLRVT